LRKIKEGIVDSPEICPEGSRNLIMQTDMSGHRLHLHGATQRSCVQKPARAGWTRPGVFVTIGVAAIYLMATAGASVAQPASANAQRGRELAASLCSGCHVIGHDTSGTVRADVPSFPAIAGRTGVTAEYLAGRIIVPHPAMPGVPLTAAEIRDIVAFILALKQN
jgi:cytochrome c